MATFIACARAYVDDPIAGGDDLYVMLDDDDGVAGYDQVFQLALEAIDIGGVETCGGFVEDVERIAALGALEFCGELDPLGFATGEFCGGLA